MSERRWEHINLPKAYVSEAKINSKTGWEFYTCTIPKDIVLDDGTPIGGYRFNVNYVDDPITDWSKKGEDGHYERNPEAKFWDISVPEGELTLTKSERLENGEYKLIDSMKISSESLKKAMRNSYLERRKEQEKNKTKEPAESKPEKVKKERKAKKR